MATVQSGIDVNALRRRVRNSQHVRSIPLIVLGALLVNYGTNLFGTSPVAWRYGAPLAFVLIWLVLKANEARAGVGVGRADYLIAAGFVFAATSLTLMSPIATTIQDPLRMQGLWLAITGVAVLGVAWPARDRVLGVAGLVTIVLAVLDMAKGHYWRGPMTPLPGGNPYFRQPIVDQYLGLLGAAMVIAGIVAYRFERAAA